MCEETLYWLGTPIYPWISLAHPSILVSKFLKLPRVWHFNLDLNNWESGYGPELCVCYSKISGANSHFFCIVRWFDSYDGISLSPCLGFCEFAQLLRTVSLLLDSVILGGIRKNRQYGKLQDLLFYGVYGWKGML